LSRLLAGVTERLRELLSASTVFVFLPTVGDDLQVRAGAGDAPRFLGSRVPREGAKTGHVFDRPRSERVDMMIEDFEVYQPVRGQMNAPTSSAPTHSPRMTSVLPRHSPPASPSRFASRHAADRRAPTRITQKPSGRG
jgi:hypothetical protein